MSDQSDQKKPAAPPVERKPSREDPLDLSSAMALIAENSDMLDESDFEALSALSTPKPKPEVQSAPSEAQEAQDSFSDEPSALNDWEVPDNSSPALSAMSQEEDSENFSPFPLSSAPSDLTGDDMTGSVFDPVLQQMLITGNFSIPEEKQIPSRAELAEPLVDWEEALEEREESDEFSLDAVEKALGTSEEPEPLVGVPHFMQSNAVETEPPPPQNLDNYQAPPLLEPQAEVLPFAEPIVPSEQAPMVHGGPYLPDIDVPIEELLPPEIAPQPVAVEPPIEVIEPFSAPVEPEPVVPFSSLSSELRAVAAPIPAEPGPTPFSAPVEPISIPVVPFSSPSSELVAELKPSPIPAVPEPEPVVPFSSLSSELRAVAAPIPAEPGPTPFSAPVEPISIPVVPFSSPSSELRAAPVQPEQAPTPFSAPVEPAQLPLAPTPEEIKPLETPPPRLVRSAPTPALPLPPLTRIPEMSWDFVSQATIEPIVQPAARPMEIKPFTAAQRLAELDSLDEMLASIEDRAAQPTPTPKKAPSQPPPVAIEEDFAFEEIVEEEAEASAKAPPLKAPPLPPKAPPPRPPAASKSPFSPWVRDLPPLDSLSEEDRAWLSIYSAEVSVKEAERGRLLYEAGEFYESVLQDLSSALACYRASLALLPTFEPARFGVLRLLALEQNHEAMEAQLRQSKESASGPKRASLEVERAFLLESKLKDLSRAKEAYKEASEDNPEQLAALLALSRLQQGEPEAFDEIASKIANTAPEPKWRAAWQFLRSQQRASKLSDIKGAEVALREALSIDPSVEGAASSLQRNLARQEKIPELLALLNHEADSAPSVEAAALLRNAASLSWYLQGDANAAWASVEQALAHTPNDVALLSLAIQLAQARNNPEQAEHLSKQLVVISSGKDLQPLSLELALAKLRGKEATLDDTSRQLFQALVQGELAEETLRVVGRLFRRSLQRSSEGALLLERRGHAGSDEAAAIDLWLGLLSSDINHAKQHFTSALSNPHEARYAALFLADIHKDAGDFAAEYEALFTTLKHTTNAEEASVLGFRAAYLARFLLQDPSKYAETLLLISKHQLISKKELALALEAAGRPQEAANLLKEALGESPDFSRGATRAVARRLAILLEGLQQAEAARELYIQLEASNPGDVHSILGLERSGASAEARAVAYERAAQSEESAKLALLHRAAALYLESGKFADAVRLYRSLTEQSEGSTLAAFGLLAASRALKDTTTHQEALTLLAQRRDELGAMASIERGIYLETNKQAKEAASLYERAYQSSYPIAEAGRELALALAAKEGDWTKVEELAAHILAASEVSAQPRKRVMRLTLASAYELTSAEKARAYYNEILSEAPNDIIALRGSLRCSLAMRDKISAAQCAVKLADNSTNTTALTERLLAIQLLDEAKQPNIPEQLTAALSQGKSHPAVLYAIESRRGKGALRNDLRLAYEARLNQVTPEERTVYMLRLGELEAEAGKAAQGLPILETAKERAPTDMATLLSARRVARLAENRVSFLKLSEALVSQLHEPKQIAAVLREAAMVEEAAGNVDASDALVKRALEKHPGEKSLIAVQARILSLRGNDAALHTLLEKNIEVLEEPSLALALGLAQKRLGKKEEARRSFLRALSSTPGNVSILENLYLLDYELGRFDEATELAKRLLKRANTQQEKAAGEKRLAEASSRSSRREDAIGPYLNYLKLMPDDTQTTEQFLGFVREINRHRDGIALLEGRYNATENKQERRKLAERLGKYIDLELSQPTNAAQWYANALSQDPLGAECGTRLVYLWKGKEEKRLSALLEGTHLQLAESIKENPGRWEVYRKLAEVFGWRGNRARYRAVVDLAQMVGLEGELPPSPVLLSPLTPPSRVITPDELKQLIPQHQPIRDLLVIINEILSKALPKSASDLDLGRRDRLKDGPGGERRKEVELIASRFNLKIYDAFVGGNPNKCVIFQNGAELTAIVGGNLIAKPISLETYFELGRSFTMARNGLLPILDANAADLEGIICGVMWCADEKLRERDKGLSKSVGDIAKAIYDAMTRKLKQSHMDQFASLAQSFPKNLGAVAHDLTAEADRGGLIAAGSFLSALRCVSSANLSAGNRGEEALGDLLARPRVFSLLQYALTKEYEDLALALSAI